MILRGRKERHKLRSMHTAMAVVTDLQRALCIYGLEQQVPGCQCILKLMNQLMNNTEKT